MFQIFGARKLIGESYFQSENYFLILYLKKNGSWSNVFHQVIDARGKLAEHKKYARVAHRGDNPEAMTLDFLVFSQY